ncbi:hypothetical protein Hypma_005451 [Hypsizygus marmoreus]|uniref:Uncharacterized protein n=1 Tax=Hypsizygus marmoreus TaxID=39966 RepID=A0A369J0Y8_HYPMA|nr:hypothetical protein Hypma_005451 [Hypsizygus marmoreus]
MRTTSAGKPFSRVDRRAELTTSGTAWCDAITEQMPFASTWGTRTVQVMRLDRREIDGLSSSGAFQEEHGAATP